jgi:hypothetical protein
MSCDRTAALASSDPVIEYCHPEVQDGSSHLVPADRLAVVGEEGPGARRPQNDGEHDKPQPAAVVSSPDAEAGEVPKPIAGAAITNRDLKVNANRR